MSNDSAIEYECDDILTLLRAFPDRIFERHSIQKGLDLSITSFHDVRLQAAGVEVWDSQPVRYRWSSDADALAATDADGQKPPSDDGEWMRGVG